MSGCSSEVTQCEQLGIPVLSELPDLTGVQALSKWRLSLESHLPSKSEAHCLLGECLQPPGFDVALDAIFGFSFKGTWGGLLGSFEC